MQKVHQCRLSHPHAHIIILQVVLAFASEPIADTSLLLDRRLWILVVMAILAPLSYLRTLNALRHISALAIVSVIYLCAIVVYHYFTPGLLQKPEQVDLWHITPGIFSKLPVFIFAFTCHQNVSGTSCQGDSQKLTCIRICFPENRFLLCITS